MRWQWMSRGLALLFLPVLQFAVASATEADDYADPSPPVYDVEEFTTFKIPMSDGVELGGYMYLPVAREAGEKFPVLLYSTPYRERLSPGEKGERGEVGWFFPERGYALVYVGLRGTGISGGAVPDREYSDAEISDLVEAVEWLSRQPWSNGNVGMFGISWAGFNTARVAMRQPPALKAISINCASEDVYFESDWMWNGILYIDAYHNWIDVSLARSPDPDHPLTDEYFRNRFDHTPWDLVALRHQAYGPYWEPDKRADRNPDIIEAATMLRGGFRDAYRSSIPRMLSHLNAPTKAVVGYLGHGSDTGPGPALVDEDIMMLRWWDYWLKGRDTGIMDEPRVTVFMPRSHDPSPWVQPGDIEGEWRAEHWPPEGLTMQTMYLHPDHRLDAEPPKTSADHRLQYVPSAGLEAGLELDPAQHGIEDQRGYDAFSLVYDTEPLEKETAILGTPSVTLNASASAELAHWFVRISDVAPDGKVVLVTEGALNGAYRDDPMKPSALEPATTYTLGLDLYFAGWVFEPGHRIRVAVSNAAWPVNWPSPHPMTTTLVAGPRTDDSPVLSHVVLPVVPAKGALPLPDYAKESKWPEEYVYEYRYGSNFTVVTDPKSRITSLTAEQNLPYPPGADRQEYEKITWTVNDLKPAEASVLAEHRLVHNLPGRTLVYEQRSTLRSDKENFYYDARRTVTENGKLVREQTFDESVPRYFR